MKVSRQEMQYLFSIFKSFYRGSKSLNMLTLIYSKETASLQFQVAMGTSIIDTTMKPLYHYL